MSAIWPATSQRLVSQACSPARRSGRRNCADRNERDNLTPDDGEELPAPDANSISGEVINAVTGARLSNVAGHADGQRRATLGKNAVRERTRILSSEPLRDFSS